MNQQTFVTGFPRIGKNRELKRALEKYWAGRISAEDLQKTSLDLRKKHWRIQKEKGIDFISCNDFSLYDIMLDTAVMLNAVPERFREISDKTDRYFAMARGSDSASAMEMTKWFNTNYHYLVPELSRSIRFRLDASKIISEYNEAKELGIHPKINIIGPITFLGLSKAQDDEDPYSYYYTVIPIYRELVEKLSSLDNVVYVQMEEPVFVKEPDKRQLELLKNCYDQLACVRDNVKLIVMTYFEHSNEATSVLIDTPVWGIGLDLVHGKKNTESLEFLKDKKLIAGVVDGRNIWINDFEKTLKTLTSLCRQINKEQIIISSSCSLLHIPYTAETEPESKIKKWMSFAYEKLDEIALLNRMFRSSELSGPDLESLKKNRLLVKKRKTSPIIKNEQIINKINKIQKSKREGSFSERIKLQKNILKLPCLPTTTIGSFPQTKKIRQLRKDYRKKVISRVEYEEGIKKYIDECVAFQQRIGLDVLVHGEPERSDMVEYFGEMLEGFHFTDNGWVQSYGSRCVKPPVIYGDISRPEPMTVKWITYAQSQTGKPMKGMLTGPVTILNWSFVRDDKERAKVSRQIAAALRDEINDLQSAGIKVIQVDEPAFKEGYPLRPYNIPEYEKWAVDNFKLAVSKAKKETQIHTHMCYSEFNDIIKTIEAMDADVITIENTRSGNELLKVFTEIGYSNQIGPGVYDIHSPRVPSSDEFIKQIEKIMDVLPAEQLWINPDCGLKTREWEEVKPSLRNMVRAAKSVRSMSS
jgi:5-methyltetrahydropteroyltriglutamate--homocysteine methyltransferase